MTGTLLLAALLLAPASAGTRTGRALIRPTGLDPKVVGVVEFRETDAGLEVTASLAGLPPGEYGFHIHQFGNCRRGGEAAGPHYNPEDAPHGRHPGDMGNLSAGADGKAVLRLVLPEATLAGGERDVAGRAVVVHARPDDGSQPSGNAGARIGCGSIVLREDTGAP